MEKRLFLLDAYALIFRAYYALIKMPRINSAGFNTSAIFGFVNTLEELLRKEKPTHLAVCFDPAGPTFRSEAYAEYKGERPATPEDIRLSVPVIKEIVEAYRIPLLEVPGFEADDVIGTMALRAASEGYTSFMMTPDKDFGQLVGPGVLQYKPSYRGQDAEIRGEKEVCGRYGLSSPCQVVDLLALMGDKADNIPGCPGVGEKTAVKLIAEFGGVDGLLENTGSVKGALRKKIEENAAQIRFSRFLATIRTDVPLECRPDDLLLREPDREHLFSIFDRLEFRQLRQRVEKRLSAAAVPDPAEPHAAFAASDAAGTEVAEATAIKGRYEVADTRQVLDKLRKTVDGLDRIGLMMVSDGENDMTARWTGTAVATSEGRAWYVPCGFSEGREAVLDMLARPDLEKVTASAKRDYVMAGVARCDGATPLVNYYDISLAHYLLQPEQRHTPAHLARTMLRLELPEPPASMRGKGQTGDLFAESESSADMVDYACAQADAILRLRNVVAEAVEDSGMKHLLCDIELPLSEVLARMEMTGVRIDVGVLGDAADRMRDRIARLEKEIHELAGETFNVGSPAQVGEILFGKLALDPKAKKTRTGQYSTSEEILEKLVPRHPVVGLILEYRQHRKLLNTYLTALPEAINPATGKVHTNYNQTVTATGRISSSSPNLQNIPVRDDEGKEIRRAFIADEGHLFFSADYSQIELRLVADFAGDSTMLDAFRSGADIHAITAARIYHKDPSEVTGDERRHAKTANFGILYGISAFGLASRLGIPRTEAKQLIDNYFATFPAIHKYMTDSIESARAKGYVSTRMGRKRYLADINSRNPTVRGYAERNAINAPVQGSAADIIKKAMVDIHREMKARMMKSKMIMQVHDELNFDVVPEELPQLQEMVVRLMENAYKGAVTLEASYGVADNWLDAH